MNWLHDLKSALRSLLARPSFFATATATLALGVCALAAIFAVYDGVLLKPLPYADADRIVAVSRVQPPVNGASVSRPVFQEWRDGSAKVFDAFGGFVERSMNLTGAGAAERLVGATVTPGFWQVFGTPVALGRAFGDDEETHDQKVVVLSDALWRDRFGASPDAIGRDITLGGDAYRVIGVAAASFRYPDDVKFWTPTFLPGSTQQRGNNYLSMVARLRDGASPSAAKQMLDGVATWEARNWPDDNGNLSARVVPLQEALFGRLQQPLTMLLIASALVLLIACANLANLMLARGQQRERELALRRALGAGRNGLVRAVLAETAVICALGAAVGLLVAGPAVHALLALAPTLLPAQSVPGVDWRVAGVALAAASATLLLAGLAPAWRAAHADPAAALRGGGRDVGGSRAQGRLRRALVAAELAIALSLLGGSALLLESLRNLSEVDTGVHGEGVLTARISLGIPTQTAGEDLMAYLTRLQAANGPQVDALLARVAALPGVVAAGAVDALPISGGGGGNGGITIPGHDIPEDENLAEFRFASPDYFKTLGIPLRAGRVFDAHDASEGFGSNLLVNEAFVAHFLGGKDAVGQQVGAIDGQMRTIVGVVGDVRQFGLEEAARPERYLPARATWTPDLSIVVKTDGDAAALAEPLRRTLAQFAPDMPVYAVRTMDEATRRTTAMRRFNLTLMSAFAVVALVLAAIGLYGVISWSVSQRRRELGVRQALGATRGDVHRLMLGAGLRMVAPGIILGMLGALALGKLIAAQLYGVGSADPFALGAVAALLCLVAVAACAMPTLRAARVPPMEALRDE